MSRFLILPFIFALLLPAQALAAQHPSCKADKIDTWTSARIANSGNAITINTTQFQLAGIYAPEMGNPTKRSEPPMPLSKEAQTLLNHLLAKGSMQVGVVYDTSKANPMKKAEAHFFLKDGTNLGAAMIQEGFALSYSLPPNAKFLECYTESEKEARANKKGLWAYAINYPLARYPLAPSSDLTVRDQGFRIIQGEVKSVSRTANNYIINLDTTGIRVQKKFWKHFDFKDLQALKGEMIEVRGYGFAIQGAMYITVYHPSAINKLNKYD